MRKYKLLGILIFITGSLFAQREHRILASQFPKKGIDFIKKGIPEAKRLKYYTEIDSIEARFAIHFKKDRLKYHLQVTPEGAPYRLGCKIKAIAIPEDIYTAISTSIQQLKKPKVLKILQYYPLRKTNLKIDLRNALQNLMVTNMEYEILIREKGKDHVLVFSSKGKLISKTCALPVNYDHILY